MPIENLIENGGFETGDFTGWTKSGVNVTISSLYKHSGTYACKFENGGYIEQDVIIAVANIISFNMWGFVFGKGSGNWIKITVTYTDDGTTIITTTASDSGFQDSGNLVGLLTPTKTVKKIQILSGCGGGCDVYLDDVSLLYNYTAPSITPINPYVLKINLLESNYIKVHYVKNHPSEDPNTFDITVNRDVGESVNYFDPVEVIKNGVTEFYGFVEEITPQKGTNGLDYLLTGRCWKLIPWKKQIERYQESREIGPEDIANNTIESGFFGSIYPHELFKFILRCPVSEHPKGKVRHKIGWGIASDYWKCCSNVTADAHYPDWVMLRYTDLAWRNRGSVSSFSEEQLDVDTWNSVIEQWSKVGADPYLDSSDESDYIHVYYVYEDPNKTMSEFTFANLVGSYASITNVTVNIKIACSMGYAKVAVWIYSITEGWQVAGYIEWGYGVSTYKSIDVTSILDTQAKINGAKIAFTSINAIYSWGHPYIYHAYLHVKGWLDTEGSYLQQTNDYFIVDMGAIKEDVTAVLIESRVNENMYAENYKIQYCILSNCGNTTYPPDESDWLDFDDNGAIVKHNNTARDILHSWKPEDVRCIRIKLVANAEPAWEISQIYIWQADNSRYRVLNE